MGKNVVGAQAKGFNAQTVGVSSLGNHDPGSTGAVAPSSAVLTSVAKLIAWKGSLNGWDPKTSATYTSAGNSKWPVGTVITKPRVSGHRDFNDTDCPGDYMYDRLATIRSTATAVYSGLSTTAAVPPSSLLETYTRPAGTSFTLAGRGFGHGLGMSQYGAYGAALKGLTRDQILSFYYPSTTRSTTLGNPTLRVRLGATGSGGTQVVHQGGLVASDGSRTLALSGTNSDGTSRTRWRVVPGSTGLTLQWLQSGTWRSVSGWTALSAPISLSNADPGQGACRPARRHPARLPAHRPHGPLGVGRDVDQRAPDGPLPPERRAVRDAAVVGVGGPAGASGRGPDLRAVPEGPPGLRVALRHL